MGTQSSDPTFIPIKEFNRHREEHARKLKPGECFWECNEPAGSWRTIDGAMQRRIRLVGVVIGPEYIPSQ